MFKSHMYAHARTNVPAGHACGLDTRHFAVYLINIHVPQDSWGNGTTRVQEVHQTLSSYLALVKGLATQDW